MHPTTWLDGNLRTQGYCLSLEDQRRLAAGLRFSTCLCLALIVTGLVLRSPPLLPALGLVAAVAGASARHPFDHLWNHGLRHLLSAPPLPPNPRPRRLAFRFASAWVLAVAGLLAAGAVTPALVLGWLLVGGCTAVTAVHLCLPSVALAAWERRNRPREVMPT